MGGTRELPALPAGARRVLHPLEYIFGELGAPEAEQGMEDFSASRTSLKEVPEAPGRSWGQWWG